LRFTAREVTLSGRNHFWFVGRESRILATPVYNSVTHGWIDYEPQIIWPVGDAFVVSHQFSTPTTRRSLIKAG
jgi:hypothetical protein